MVVRTTQSPLVPTNRSMMLMPRNRDPKNKPDFDDSCRSGATHLDFSTSDRSVFDGVDFCDARSKILPKSCLAVKTQQESLRKLSTSEHMQSTPRSSLRRSSTSSSISFDKIIVRNYDVIITDNPSTTTGPPIGLGWTHDHSDETVDVDAYESCRVPPKSKRDFVLPSAVRWEMLRSAGSSNEDLMKASHEVKKRQTQRQRSLRRQERMESFASAIRCIVPRRKGQQG